MSFVLLSQLLFNKYQHLEKVMSFFFFVVFPGKIILFLFLFFQCFLLSLAMAINFYMVCFFFEIRFFVFKESTLQYWKKIQVQITVFNKKAVIKMCSVFNSKRPPWNLVKIRTVFFVVSISKLVCWIVLSFDCELMVNIKQ